MWFRWCVSCCSSAPTSTDSPSWSTGAALSDLIVTDLRVGTSDELRTATLRSHLPDGRCVGWWGHPPPGHCMSMDAELDVTPPVALVRRFGGADFWGRWTRTECAAKLFDVPVVVWWHRFGLDPPIDDDLVVATMRPRHLDPRLVVSVAYRPDRPSGCEPARSDEPLEWLEHLDRRAFLRSRSLG